MYVIRNPETGQFVKANENDPQKTAMDESGRPLWTGERELALEWLKPGGAEAWWSWWFALWSASEEDPPCEIEVYHYEDPTRTIGGEDD